MIVSRQIKDGTIHIKIFPQFIQRCSNDEVLIFELIHLLDRSCKIRIWFFSKIQICYTRELSIEYPVCFPLWSPLHAIVIIYFIVYSPHFNHFIPSFEPKSVLLLFFEYVMETFNVWCLQNWINDLKLRINKTWLSNLSKCCYYYYSLKHAIILINF